LMMRQEFVCFVEKILTQINTQRRNAVQTLVPLKCVGVKEKKKIGKIEVFTIKTSDGTFFVDDYLSSNCDSIRYVTFTMKQTDQKPWESTIPGNSGVKLVRPMTQGLFGVQR